MPPPPPPPLMNLNLTPGPKVGGGSNSGDARNALLSSIQKGTKLKKTVTVDKSGPMIAGKTVNANGSSTNTNSLGSLKPRNTELSGAGDSNTKPLGGIFGGMSTMPKLKPVGSKASPDKPSYNNNISNINNNKPAAKDTTDNCVVKNLPVMDFGTELANRIKKQSKSDVPNESNLRLNRGPPPMPPSMKVDSSSQSQERNGAVSAAKAKFFEQEKNSSVSESSPGSSPNLSLQILPNRSSLFASNSTSTTQSSTKVAPNHGKPNLAPKPPSVSQQSDSNNTANSSNIVNSSSSNARTSVARHHSMKSPRSPGTPNGLQFPSNANYFGTIRIPPGSNVYKSSESISKPTERTLAAFPKPNKPPPPPPNRSKSNTNLPNLSVSTAGNNQEFGSVNNIPTTIRDSSTKSSMSVLSLEQSNESPPRLPPHRQCPAPPKAMQLNNSIPPAPPQRTTSRPRVPLNEIVVDLEGRFMHYFHNVTEFPKPSPFQNLHKVYMSQMAQKVQHSNVRKQQRAPNPPIMKGQSGILQLDDKLFTNNSSNC